MCGINGFIQFKHTYTREYLRKQVHSMNEKIIHRGPDSEGLYEDDYCALGMRRLSIIDLNGGYQPIWNEQKDKLIIFNGEIYNFKELRALLIREGHVFSTKSDTEVVLHGYESYGISFLKRIEGMFALVIYDLKKQVWILARDRIGEKPLYYFHTENFFIFGSELKSLLATGLISKEIDKDALSQYFQLTYIPAPKSIIQSVNKLMPASVMTLHADGCMQLEKYWGLNKDHIGDDKDYEACKKSLRENLFNSVEQRMVSDVPLGAYLSGGFDSSIIVGIMSQLSTEPINTFTIGFKEKQYDESKLANLVAKKNHTKHHVLYLDWRDAVFNIETVLENMDEPFADSSLIATYEVSKLTKEHVTVALSGDAGDELFAGYNKYLISYYDNMYKKMPAILRKGVIEPASRLLPVKSSLSRKIRKVINSSDLTLFEQRKKMMCLGFQEDELKELMLDGDVDSMSFIRNEYDYLATAPELMRTQYVDLITVLEGDMLAKVDRASMLASLETRVPMLDSNVIELAFSMPIEYKISKTKRKIILKDTFNDLLPKELFYAPKHGFSVPIGKWLETILGGELLRYADKEYLETQGLFNVEYICKTIDSHMTHKEDRSSELWAFYVFQNWYERVMQS